MGFLRFLKANNPSIVVFNLVFIILFRLLFFLGNGMNSLPPNHTEPLASVLTYFLPLHSTIQIYISLALSAVLVFLQSLLINKILGDYKISSRRNYFAGIVFVLFTSLFKAGLLLSAELFSLTFLLLFIDTLFALSKQEKMPSKIFDAGFFVSLSFLIYFPSIVLYLLVFIGLFTFRSIQIKEMAILLIGLATPLIAAFTWYFWFDNLNQLFPELLNSINKIPFGFYFSPKEIITLCVLGTASLWVAIQMQFLILGTSILTRKFVGFLFILLLIITASYVLQSHPTSLHFLLMSAPLSVFFTIYFTESKGALLSDVIFSLLFIFTVIIQFF